MLRASSRDCACAPSVSAASISARVTETTVPSAMLARVACWLPLSPAATSSATEGKSSSAALRAVSTSATPCVSGEGAPSVGQEQSQSQSRAVRVPVRVKVRADVRSVGIRVRVRRVEVAPAWKMRPAASMSPSSSSNRTLCPSSSSSSSSRARRSTALSDAARSCMSCSAADSMAAVSPAESAPRGSSSCIGGGVHAIGWQPRRKPTASRPQPADVTGLMAHESRVGATNMALNMAVKSAWQVCGLLHHP
eukprot:scaffold59329_cov56-Phaeocystis_antarctica.AAC.4